MIITLNPNQKVELAFHSSDPGYCRVYFVSKHSNVKVCFQECGYGSNIVFELLYVTDWDEPSHSAAIESIKSVEIPDDIHPDNYINTHFVKWLKKEFNQ